MVYIFVCMVDSFARAGARFVDKIMIIMIMMVVAVAPDGCMWSLLQH